MFGGPRTSATVGVVVDENRALGAVFNLHELFAQLPSELSADATQVTSLFCEETPPRFLGLAATDTSASR